MFNGYMVMIFMEDTGEGDYRVMFGTDDLSDKGLAEAKAVFDRIKLDGVVYRAEILDNGDDDVARVIASKTYVNGCVAECWH